MKSTKLAVTSTGQPKLTFCTTRPAINFIMLVCKEHVASNAMEAQTKTYRTIFYNNTYVRSSSSSSFFFSSFFALSSRVVFQGSWHNIWQIWGEKTEKDHIKYYILCPLIPFGAVSKFMLLSQRMHCGNHVAEEPHDLACYKRLRILKSNYCP